MRALLSYWIKRIGASASGGKFIRMAFSEVFGESLSDNDGLGFVSFFGVGHDCTLHLFGDARFNYGGFRGFGQGVTGEGRGGAE